MASMKNLCLEKTEYKNETFGNLELCNFQEAKFTGCAFTDKVYGCNFERATFVDCDFSGGTFNACNFTGAIGMGLGKITGEANNFGEAL